MFVAFAFFLYKGFLVDLLHERSNLYTCATATMRALLSMLNKNINL